MTDPGLMPEPPFEIKDGLPAGETTAVRVQGMRSPILHEPGPPMRPDADHALEVVVDLWSFRFEAVIVIAVAAPLAIAGQAGLALAGAACTAAVLLMRRIGHRVEFGLGDGFLGYRGAPGWPRGVQEEYDVTWGAGGHRRSGNRA